MSTFDREQEQRIIATMTRDQLVLFGQMHKRFSDMRCERDQLRRLAFGAGMALAGVVPDPEHGADFATAQDLIAQMLVQEEAS